MGLIVTGDPQGHKVVVKHLSRSKDAFPEITRYWQNEQLEAKPNVRLSEPGVVEVSATLGHGDQNRLFGLMLLLAQGHGLCL